jgi:hypothetical protein
MKAVPRASLRSYSTRHAKQCGIAVDFPFFFDSFPIDDQMNMKSVVEYFKEMYGFTIQQSHLPCLMVGNQKKANYLPMEVRTSKFSLSSSILHLVMLFAGKSFLCLYHC